VEEQHLLIFSPNHIPSKEVKKSFFFDLNSTYRRDEDIMKVAH
jgi:hypothetical protein